MINVGAMVATMTLDTKKFTLGMQKATKAVSPIKAGLVKLGTTLKTTAKHILNLKTAFLALGVAMASRAVLGQFQRFETALVDMGKVTTRSLAGIRKEVMSLEASLGTATDLMAGYYQVISAGVKGADEQLKTLIVTSRAAIAAHVSQAEIIKGLTAIVDAYEGKVRDAAEAADILFTIERLGKTTVAELIPIIGSLASMSATMKISQDELGGSLAQLTKFIGSTAEAGTQLKALYTALISPNEQLNALFEEQGGVLKAIEEIGFIEVLKKMQDATEGNVEALKKLMEGRREALLGFLSLAKQGFIPVTESIKEMEKKMGAMDRAFKAWRKTLAATYLVFRSTFGKVLIDIGQEIAPGVQEMIEELSLLLQKHKDEIISTIRGIKDAMVGWVKANADFLTQDVPAAIIRIKDSLKGLYEFYQTLPEGIVGVAGVGIVGRVIFGAWKPAAVVAFLYIVNKELKKIGLAITDVPKKSREAWEAIKNIFVEIKALFKEVEVITMAVPPELIRIIDPRKVKEGTKEVSVLKDVIVTAKKDFVEWTDETFKLGGALQNVSAVILEFPELPEWKFTLDPTWDEALKESNEFIDALRANWSDLFYDVMRGELDSFEDYFSAFCDTILRTFADMLAQELAKWIVHQAAMKAATVAAASFGVSATATPILGGAAVAGAIAMPAALYAYSKSRMQKQREENRRAFEQLQKLTVAWSETTEEITAMLYATSNLEVATRRVNKQFDSYIATLKDLGAPIEKITWLEEKRAKALARTREQLIQEFAVPLENIIAQFQLSDLEYELYRLDNWYKDQIENARSLGLESVKLLREAYELSKKELALREQRVLTGSIEDLLNMVATLGMTAIESQIHAIEKANADLLASWQPSMDQIAGLPTVLADYAAEIDDLQTVYVGAIKQYGVTQDRWENAQDAMIATLQKLSEYRMYEPIFEEMARLGITGVEEMVRHLAPHIAGWTVQPYVGVREEYYAAELAFQQAATEFLPSIKTIPGEIKDLITAIGDYETLVDSLAGTMDEATVAAIKAYAAQMDALRDEFLGGLDEIIRSHTLSEYEQQVYALNEWYKEQKTNAEALGLSLDKLNLAYAYQLQSIENTEEGIDDWTSALKSLQNQILDIETSLANPVDVLERMAILEGEIAAKLGADWRAGIFDMAGLSPKRIGELQSLLGDYLGMAADAFQRPSMEYQNLYTAVLGALGGLEEEAVEAISEYDILQAQLDTLLSIEEILSEGIPSLQAGTGYVPETGLYRLHEGERVSPPGVTELSLSIQINESASPRETGREVVSQTEAFFKSARGRKMVQQTAAGL